MANLKKTIIAATLLTFLPISALFAAEEISPEKAEQLTPFKEISAQGTFYSFSDAARVISKLADKAGADYFYIKSMNMHSSNESLRIAYADLYKADAADRVVEEEKLRQFKGVYEYPKGKALLLEPYDIIKMRGYYPNQYDINQAVGKAAANKGAYAFFIDRQVETNGRNTEVTAYLFKQDAPTRLIQPEDAIPYDSEAGRLALAQGGEAALQVEKPGYYSSTAFNEQFYTNKFNAEKTEPTKSVTTASETVVETATSAANNPTQQAATTATSIIPTPPSSRYSVTLPNGTKIEELNNKTALKMIPFDSIKFKGYYVSDSEISYQAAKRAAENGAKYYHITRIAQDTRGPNRTIYVDLFK